tara:strand:+ start:9022 stop:9765 length:744 start_codon:yes stop_codon:yes gene_type:complete
MILLIDIGNTNTVLGVYDKNKYLYTSRINSESQFEVELKSLIKYNIDEIAISSVVPIFTKSFSKVIKQYFQINPFLISFNNCNKIILNVEQSKEVGNDRICNTRAAIELTKKNCLVLDFGTATTYDVINDKQEFIGGAIAPGIKVSAENLINKASLLENTTFDFPDKIIGRNTITNIQSGVMFGAVFSIEGMIQNIEKELNTKLDIILTGGFSKLISSKLSFKHKLEPNLTLDGIRLIYEDNHVSKQ